MKNVTCRKLVIDRSKAPDKLGTLKDISLFESFEFPTAGPYSGGLVAQSLAGIGKEMKKTNSSYKPWQIALTQLQGQQVFNTAVLHVCQLL